MPSIRSKRKSSRGGIQCQCKIQRQKQMSLREIRSLDLVHDLAIISLMEVNIHEAKTHLSRLLDRVAMGEEVIIAKSGKPIAKLVPLNAGSKRRRLGTAKGEFTVPEDFNEPLPKEIEDLFWK